MRDAIYQLPRYRLESDLTQGVLDQIVDQTAVPPAQPMELFSSYSDQNIEPSVVCLSKINEEVGEISPAVRGTPSVIDTPAPDRRRIYLWPAVAIAAAVLLMIFSGSDPTEKDQSLTRVDTSPSLERSPSQPGATESLKKSLLELKDKGTRDQMVLGNQARDAEHSRDAGNVSATTKAVLPERLRSAREESASQSLPSRARAADANHRLITYTFHVPPALDLQSQLNNLTDNDQQMHLIDLGVRQKGEFDHHIFELYGDPESTARVIKALKDTAGITQAPRKNYFRQRAAKQSSTQQHSNSEFKREGVPFRPASTSIQMIFIVPAS